MNKKGITDTVLLLILSSIVVAMIFIGGMLAYQDLACYAGVNWSQQSYPGPQEKSFFASRIEMNFTYTDPITSTSCSGEGPAKCATADDYDECIIDNTADCEARYPNPNIEYVDFNINVKYKGSTFSKVAVEAKETSLQTYTDPTLGIVSDIIETTIFNGITEEKMVHNQDYNFAFTQPITYDCDGSNLTIKAYASDQFATGIVPSYWREEFDFCLTPPTADVNVSVISFDQYPQQATAEGYEAVVAITGNDVTKYCPNATFAFTAFNGTGTLVRIDECNTIIDTKQGDWFEDYKFRTNFTVTNNIGIDLDGVDETQVENKGELVNVTLNFRNSQLQLPSDPNFTDCNELAIRKAGSNRNIKRWVDPNSMVYEEVNRDVNGDGNIDSNDKICVQTDVIFILNEQIPAEETQTFYAYFEWADGSQPAGFSGSSGYSINSNDATCLTSFDVCSTLTKTLPEFIWNPDKASDEPVLTIDRDIYFFNPLASYVNNVFFKDLSIQLKRIPICGNEGNACCMGGRPRELVGLPSSGIVYGDYYKCNEGLTCLNEVCQ